MLIKYEEPIFSEVTNTSKFYKNIIYAIFSTLFWAFGNKVKVRYLALDITYVSTR